MGAIDFCLRQGWQGECKGVKGAHRVCSSEVGKDMKGDMIPDEALSFGSFIFLGYLRSVQDFDVLRGNRTTPTSDREDVEYYYE